MKTKMKSKDVHWMDLVYSTSYELYETVPIWLIIIRLIIGGPIVMFIGALWFAGAIDFQSGKYFYQFELVEKGLSLFATIQALVGLGLIVYGIVFNILSIVRYIKSKGDEYNV